MAVGLRFIINKILLPVQELISARMMLNLYGLITFPKKSKILISLVYRPPNLEVNDFNHRFERLLDYICSEEKETIILGDLNCDLAAKKKSADTKELCKLFKIYQFIQLIRDPTRIVERSSTLIDLAFTTDHAKILDSGAGLFKAGLS